ncbi:MAG TPA: chorismate synthase, partial [Nitriliruptoraceae bacterium]|nr:chorismate synthase [Nitriliruptoraceae bacterium]
DGFRRLSNRAGGIEAGMSNGQPLVLRAVMKPLSSLPQPLRTADIDSHEAAVAITQRSDACAVPRAGVVLEHAVAFELAAALLEKTGGDTVAEVTRNLAAYLDDVAAR